MSVCQTHLLPVRLLQRKRENTNQRLEKKKQGAGGDVRGEDEERDTNTSVKTSGSLLSR